MIFFVYGHAEDDHIVTRSVPEQLPNSLLGQHARKADT
jgi:hypothetical protein